MQETKGLLNSEEVDFLMEVANADAKARTDQQDGPQDSQVTMRGDLERINLADIFQTLAMSKMEGLLRVRNPLEQREVYFRDGFVRMLVPPRLENRRLGQRLVKAGLLTPESLRSALLEQAKEHMTLGNLLVERGYVSSEEVEEVALLQITEDLFSLFTWQHGTFEFYRGSCPDPLLARQLENCPEFEINSLLLEVARRTDEWAEILKSLRSLDEIPVLLESRFELEDGQLTDAHRALMEAIDGQKNYRELADAALLSLFESSRCARDLIEWRQIEPANTLHCIQVAEQYLDQGDSRRAVMTLQMLCDRDEEFDLEVVGTIAEMLKRGGEGRLAGRVLLQTAQVQIDPALTLELARHAHSLASRDIEVLRFLRTTLRAHEGSDPEEVLRVTLDLADGLLDADQFEEALEVLTEAAEVDPDNPSVLLRRARLLHRRKQPQDAVQVLLRIAEIYASTQQRDKLADVYEQILKIDPEHKDAAKALRKLRARKLLKRRTLLAGSAAAVAVVAGTILLWKNASFQSRLHGAAAEIAGFIEANDLAAATSALQAHVATLGNQPEFDDLRQRIQFASAEEANRARREAKRLRSERMGLAAGHLAAGRFPEAFGIYDELYADSTGRAEVVEVVNARLSAMADDLERLAKELPFYLPQSPGDLVDRRKVERILKELRDNFKEDDRKLAEGLLGTKDSFEFPEYCDPGLVRRCLAAAAKVRDLHEQGRARIDEYEAAKQRIDNEHRLDPLFEAARRYEREQEFEKALKSYRRLEREYTGDPDLKAHFRDMVERYATIVRYLEVISTATRSGDFATAQSQYRALKLAYPDIAFDRVRLPLRIETRPPGARVLVNGTVRGRSPLLLEYSPADEIELVVQMEGFVTERATIRGDRVGLVRSLMALQPSWSTKLNGPVTHAGVLDEQGRAFLTDRSGAVHALRVEDGEPLWQNPFSDLNGFLPTPILFQDRLLVASLDGTLRCLNRADGKPVWEVDGLPCEVRPALCGRRLLLATADGRLVAVDPESGKVLHERRQGQVLADPVSLGGDVLLATEGRVSRVSGANGAVVWQAEVGSGLVARPAVCSTGIAAAAEDGSLSLLNPETGSVIWQTGELVTTPWAPLAAGRNIVLADREKILLLSGDTGKVLAAVPVTEGARFSCSPALVGDRVVIGQTSGRALVLDVTDLELLYQVRGEASPAAPAATTTSRDLVIGFENKQVLVFRRLP